MNTEKSAWSFACNPIQMDNDRFAEERGPAPRITELTPQLKIRSADFGASTTMTSAQATARTAPHRSRGTRTLLSYQIAMTARIGAAVAKCSNQADLHMTFINPIWPSELLQRPSLTSMPLTTD
jgi:hypothetical protein